MRISLLVFCGLAACAAPPAPVAVHEPPAPFCTRTLGMAECFVSGETLPDHPAELADTPIRAPRPAKPLAARIAEHWNNP